MRKFIPDEEQSRVIDFCGGRALVLAAPGCGKTEILSHRIVKAHSDYGVSYADMLCLTFTNRASREMRERVKATIGDETDDLFIGNLHRFCIHFLYANQLVPIDAGIIDDTDQTDIIQELAGNRGLGTLKIWEIGAIIGHACEERERRAGIPYHIHSERGTFPYAEILANDYLHFMRENRLMDYDDILYYAYASLANQAARESIEKSSYGWIQVDEIQDLNPLQMAIIELLATPAATVVYLGDERQSIYSFLGAKRESLERIQEQCGKNVFYLAKNYRAPLYLLDMLNDYASEVLRMDVRRLPSTTNSCNVDDALLLKECFDRTEQQRVVASITKRISDKAPDESIGILMRTNKDASELSDLMNSLGIEHLAITNRDIFKTKSFKTLYSHFSVVTLDTAFTDWSKIMLQAKILPDIALIRRCIRKMRNIGVTPLDLMTYDTSTYIMEYVKSYRGKEIVVFDTETTGVDTSNDDIIQISGCKMRDGEIVPGSEIDLMIKTNRQIPVTLADGYPNPMVEEYRLREALEPGNSEALMTPEEAFRLFIDYVGNSDLLGHNINFDLRILSNNIRRRTPELEFKHGQTWDTLALARRLDPNLRRHNLATLLEVYGLEGQNSHNAADDVFATCQLARLCYKKSRALIGEHRAFLSHDITKMIQDRLRKRYQPLYDHTATLLHGFSETTLTRELKYIHDRMVELSIIHKLPNLENILKLFDKAVLEPEEHTGFAEQLFAHLHELRTFNEADLYQNGIVSQKVHVMTIHKAKGLQFDNVIIPEVSKDFFPRSTGRKPEEDARLLYVGLSRARKRIILTYVGKLSPFLSLHPKILEHFSQMP